MFLYRELWGILQLSFFLSVIVYTHSSTSLTLGLRNDHLYIYHLCDNFYWTDKEFFKSYFDTILGR